jgi:adenylate cyclase
MASNGMIHGVPGRGAPRPCRSRIPLERPRPPRPSPDEAPTLRRFVNTELAQRIARGEEIDTGERRACVFFSDLRDYTHLSETRTAAEIFTFLSSYTALVSRVIQSWGGLPLEFHGDGAMAVFGALEDHAGKEAAAVAAARELVDAADALHLRVSVGIATGSVFVGCLPAADRAVWVVVGNTTILAARLEQMTRSLGASIVIDEATLQGLSEREGFVRHASVTIRGRRRRENLYSMAREPLATLEHGAAGIVSQ